LERHNNQQQSTTIYNIKQQQSITTISYNNQQQQKTKTHTQQSRRWGVSFVLVRSCLFLLSWLDFVFVLEESHNQQQSTTIYNKLQATTILKSSNTILWSTHTHTQQSSRRFVSFAVRGSFGCLGWISVCAWSITTINNKQESATKTTTHTTINTYTSSIVVVKHLILVISQNLEQENILR
jgi:hypothetical protein